MISNRIMVKFKHDYIKKGKWYHGKSSIFMTKKASFVTITLFLEIIRKGQHLVHTSVNSIWIMVNFVLYLSEQVAIHKSIIFLISKH